jgi:hypothetical protein
MPDGLNPTVGLYAQPEIWWDPKCPINAEKMHAQKYNIVAVVASQLATLIISIVIGLYTGIFKPLFKCQAIKKGTVLAADGKVDTVEEAKAAQKVPLDDRLEPLLTLMKIAPIIPNLIFTSRIADVWTILSKHKCSDKITNKIIASFAAAFPSILQSSIGNLAMDLLLLIYSAWNLKRLYQRANILSVNSSVDAYSRPYAIVTITKPDEGNCLQNGDHMVHIDCFQNSYSFYCPPGYTEGMQVTLYEDGQVWVDPNMRSYEYQPERGFGPPPPVYQNGFMGYPFGGRPVAPAPQGWNGMMMTYDPNAPLQQKPGAVQYAPVQAN